MKDTVITARRKLTELLWLAGCLIAAIGVNIYAIVRYDAGWAELLSSMGYVLVFAIVLYMATVAIRLAVRLLVRIFSRKGMRGTENRS
ncbi:MAG: hypothetical protein NC082_01055 [Clostridiales bacterium]|nr:hypothetical protein [Clostridiales bacterium]